MMSRARYRNPFSGCDHPRPDIHVEVNPKTGFLTGGTHVTCRKCKTTMHDSRKLKARP